MLTTFYPPYVFGGDGIGVQRLARALGRAGHEVTVVHDVDAYRMLAGGTEPPPAPEDDLVEVVQLRSRAGRLAPLVTHQTGRPLLHRRTLERVLERPFDVVNFHNVSLVGGPGLLELGDATKLYIAHEHWLVCPTHVLWRHGREPCTGRQCVRCVLRARRPLQLWRYTGALERRLAHIDAFVALTAFSRRLHAVFGFTRPMEVLPYCLPDEPVDRGGPPPHARRYVLFAGRLERLKGLDDIVPLFRADLGADLLVAGTGPHEGPLRRLAAGSPHVRFLGHLPPSALDALYAHATALLAPSVGYETFGYTLVEAFRAGTPVVARAAGPYPDLVRQSGGGLLFESASELPGLVERLVGSAELGERLGGAGRAAFRRLWSEEAVVPQYLAIVERAAARRAARQRQVG
jgi:glycosyltransferase involved in cell wall biosynthesis